MRDQFPYCLGPDRARKCFGGWVSGEGREGRRLVGRLGAVQAAWTGCCGAGTWSRAHPTAQYPVGTSPITQPLHTGPHYSGS